MIIRDALCFADRMGQYVRSTIWEKYKKKKEKDYECSRIKFSLPGRVYCKGYLRYKKEIQPNEASSTWRNYLNEHGEGIHHVAFNIQGMKMPEAVKRCEEFGMTLEQKGEYGDASGRYVYMNAYKDLKCIIELLESDK